MKRKKRDFSPRERRLIDGFIKDICRSIGLPQGIRDLHQCAWEAFLSVYRDAPFAFCGDGISGWKRAYLIIREALLQEKRDLDFWLYEQESLDIPVSPEIPVPRLELLSMPHGDFQNSVCLHDFLHRIKSRDTRLMAYDLMAGDTIDEIRTYRRWSQGSHLSNLQQTETENGGVFEHMNLKKEKRDETTASRHMSYLTILGTYMTIFGTVLGLVLSWGQLRLAHIESERARRAEPLSYSLEAVDTHYQYEIQKDGASMSIPAPSTRLQVSHGSLHSITAICFDGTTMHELAQLPIQDSWDGCVVDVTMPPKAVIPEEGLIHDYFFLFLEPTEGEGRLDLICNTISLETQEVQSRVYHPISLIQLDYLPEGPVREMLSAYAVLQERLGDLGLISA